MVTLEEKQKRVAALIVMGLAIRALALPRDLAGLQIAACMGICVGLSGLAVGLGARFPMLGQRNPARIASGFGGTFNLIASMLFVAMEMGILAFAGLIRLGGSLALPEAVQVPGWLIPTLLALGALVAAASLVVGARHFERLEY